MGVTRDKLYRYPNSYFVQPYECGLGTVSYAVSQDHENFVATNDILSCWDVGSLKKPARQVFLSRISPKGWENNSNKIIDQTLVKPSKSLLVYFFLIFSFHELTILQFYRSLLRCT